MHVWLKSIITSQHIIIHNLRTYVYSYSILFCSVISFLAHAWILSCLVRGCFVLSCRVLACLVLACFLPYFLCLAFSWFVLSFHVMHLSCALCLACYRISLSFLVMSCLPCLVLSHVFFFLVFQDFFIYPTLSSLFLSDLVMNCIICIVPAFYSIVLGICLLYYLRYPKFVFQISLCHDLPSSCSLQILIMQPFPSYRS